MKKKIALYKKNKPTCQTSCSYFGFKKFSCNDSVLTNLRCNFRMKKKMFTLQKEIVIMLTKKF